MVGFCFGGGRGLEAVAGACNLGVEVSAAVAFYPTRISQPNAVRQGLLASGVPTLIIQGDSDPISSPALAAELGCLETRVPVAPGARFANIIMEVI